MVGIVNVRRKSHSARLVILLSSCIILSSLRPSSDITPEKCRRRKRKELRGLFFLIFTPLTTHLYHGFQTCTVLLAILSLYLDDRVSAYPESVWL